MVRMLMALVFALYPLALVGCSGSGEASDLDAPGSLHGLVLTFRPDGGDEMTLNTASGSVLTWGGTTYYGFFEYERDRDPDPNSHRNTAVLKYVSLTASHSFRMRVELIFDEADYSGLDVSRVSGRIGYWSYEHKETQPGREQVTASFNGNGGRFLGERRSF